MLALEPAFAAEEKARLIEKILHDEPPMPRQLDPRIPRDLETITLKAMARDPSDRFRSALELAEDLRRFLENKSITARRLSVIDRAAKWAQRNRPVVATGVVGLLAAGAILAGGAGWILRDRAARQAMTEREVSRALDEAATFQAQAKWPEALEAAKRAQGFLAVGGSDSMRQRVVERRKDLEMVLRLEEIWLPRPIRGTEGDYDENWADTSYAEAFREYGIDVEAIEPAEAAQRVRARSIRLQLAVALDDWASRRRGVRGAGDVSSKRLLAVARADPDEWRNRLRDALENDDSETIHKLSASARVSDLPVQTLSLMGRNLDEQHGRSLLLRAQREHPDNFHINFQLAWNSAGDEKIRFLTAALAIRPRNAPTAFHLGMALQRRGKLEEAIAAYRKAIALEPGQARVYPQLMCALRAQGQRDEALSVRREAMQSRPPNHEDLNELAWFLATDPDPAFRDASLAVEFAIRAVALAPRSHNYWNTLGAARYRAGNWEGAIAAYEKSMKLRKGGTSFDWFFLAMDYWELGERDKARLWYERAVQWMEKHEPKNDELLRFRAEAAELLGLSPGADRKREIAPAGEASEAELVLPADPSAAQARGRPGQSGKGPNHHSGPPADADMPNGPEAFAHQP
jgi:tetratricopeptide (TPR) repeat protein